jgi:hypothetical protein
MVYNHNHRLVRLFVDVCNALSRIDNHDFQDTSQLRTSCSSCVHALCFMKKEGQAVPAGRSTKLEAQNLYNVAI